MRHRLRTTVRVAAATLAATAVAISVALAGGAEQAETQGASTNVIFAHADDHLPSLTATDWVTYADHVIAVTAVSESETSPAPEEIERGEGLIGRQVTLRVDDVLWSAADAPVPAPSTWEYPAVGWHFRDGDEARRAEMVLADRPRIEPGHRYILAMVWEEARCDADGTLEGPAQWRGLGEGTELPFDGGVIGQGEQEGETQSVRQARQLAADTPDIGVEEILAGQDAAALIQELSAATSVPAQREAADAEVAAAACV